MTLLNGPSPPKSFCSPRPAATLQDTCVNPRGGALWVGCRTMNTAVRGPEGFHTRTRRGVMCAVTRDASACRIPARSAQFYVIPSADASDQDVYAGHLKVHATLLPMQLHDCSAAALAHVSTSSSGSTLWGTAFEPKVASRLCGQLSAGSPWQQTGAMLFRTFPSITLCHNTEACIDLQ